MSEKRVYGEPYRNILLCVDTYDQGQMTGRYFNQGIVGGKEFKSIAQFFISAEAMFDEVNFPQSYTQKRFFVPISDQGPGKGTGAEIKTGKKGTFKIRLLYRQHSSWQGSIQWIENNSEQNFRSVLDLIILIDNALSPKRGDT